MVEGSHVRQTSSKEAKQTNSKVLRVWQTVYFHRVSLHIWLSVWTASRFFPYLN